MDNLDLLDLRGWAVKIVSGMPARFALCEPIPRWSDGIFSVAQLFDARKSLIYHYKYQGIGEAVVDFACLEASIWPTTVGYSKATLEHLWADILLPGILDHQGCLVLHAGAVVVDGLAAVFLGDSGRGKSTLTASFYAVGHTILSDDGIIVTGTETGASVEAVYPGIRLMPGTLSDLFAHPVFTTDVAHYAAKRRIVPDEKMSAAQFPAAALFFLSQPSGSGSVSISPMGAADACIGIVSKSFSLDPSDELRARSRIGQASRLVNALPTFALNYPRDIAALPQVRQAITDALEFGGSTGLRREDQLSG